MTLKMRDQKIPLPCFWLGVSIVLLVADYFAGPFIQFPITYLVPIYLASWYSGRTWGLTFAIAMPIVRLVYNIAFWTIPWTVIEASINCIIRIVVLALFAILIAKAAQRTTALNKEVKILTGLLPVCSFCKKIRDDEDQWNPIETYIGKRSEASFSHGICPECAEKHYGISEIE